MIDTPRKLPLALAVLSVRSGLPKLPGLEALREVFAHFGYSAGFMVRVGVVEIAGGALVGSSARNEEPSALRPCARALPSAAGNARGRGTRFASSNRGGKAEKETRGGGSAPSARAGGVRDARRHREG